MALEQAPEQAQPVAVSIINRLTWRAGAGDDVLAEDLLAYLRGEPLADRAVPVDLALLSTELEGDLHMSSGGWVDLLTGDVHDDSATDPMTVGEDAVIDVEDETPTVGSGSIAPGRGRAGRTWRPSLAGNVILPYGSGWSGRSKARAHSAGSAISYTRRTSTSRGTPSQATVSWAAPASSWPPRVSVSDQPQVEAADPAAPGSAAAAATSSVTLSHRQTTSRSRVRWWLSRESPSTDRINAVRQSHAQRPAVRSLPAGRRIRKFHPPPPYSDVGA